MRLSEAARLRISLEKELDAQRSLGSSTHATLQDVRLELAAREAEVLREADLSSNPFSAQALVSFAATLKGNKNLVNLCLNDVKTDRVVEEACLLHQEARM